MAYEFNDLKGLLFLVLFTIPLTTSKNINCQGKPFHCLNSTHFMICVDLGDVSSTIDDFVIPCPPTTECHKSNRFECEFPKIEEPIPPLNVIGVTKSNDISMLPPITNSTSTIVQIEVATKLPPKENNNDKDLPTLEEMTSRSKLEILENLKDEYTQGNEKFFDDSEIKPTNFTNSIYNQTEIITTNSGTNQIKASTDKTYDVQSIVETFTDNLNSKASNTTTSVAGLFTSRPDDAETINKTNFQFIPTDISLSHKVSDLMKTTPTPYIKAEQNFVSSKPPDDIYNPGEFLELSDRNYKVPKAALDIAQVSIAEMSTTDKAPSTTMNYVEFITIVDNPQTTMNKNTFTENITEINTGTHSNANERVLCNETLIETDSVTITPLELSLAYSSVTSTGNSSAKDSNNTENRQLNNLLLSTPDIIPTNNRETIGNIVTTDLSMYEVTESTLRLTKNDAIVSTESSLYEQNNTIKDMKKINLTTVSVTPEQEHIGVDINTTNNQPTETSKVITILSDELKSNSSSNVVHQNTTSSNLASTKTENVSEIYLTDNTSKKGQISNFNRNSSKTIIQVSENLNNSIGENNATTFSIIEFNDENTSETVSTVSINIGTDVIGLTTPNTLDVNMNRTSSSYDGPNKKNFSDELLLLESDSKVPNVANTLVSEAPRPMASLGPMNYTDNFHGYTTNTENSTITPNVDTSTYDDNMSSNIISDKGDTIVPINIEVKPNTVLDATSIDINNANQVTENLNYTHSLAFSPTTDIQSYAFATEPPIITQFIAETNKSQLTREEYGNEIIISTAELSNINKMPAQNTILHTTIEPSIDIGSKVQKLIINDSISTEGGKMDTATVDKTSISTIKITDQTNTVKVGNTTIPKSASSSEDKPDRTITTTESSKVNKIKTLMNPIAAKVGNTLPIELGYVPIFRDDERSSNKEVELENAKTESKGLNLALKSSAPPEHTTEKSVTPADIFIATMNPLTAISTSGPMKTENIAVGTDAISLVKAITENTTLTATVIIDTNDPKMEMEEAHEFIFNDKKGPGENSGLNKIDTANSKSEIHSAITTTIEKGNPMVNTFMPTKTSKTGAEPPATVNESTFKQVSSSPVIYKTETSQSQFIPSTTEMIETQTVYRDKIQTLSEVPEATIEQSQTILNRTAISTSTPTANADDSRIIKKQTMNQNNTSKGLEATTEQNEEHRILSTTSAPNGRFNTEEISIFIQENVHPNYSLTLPKVTEDTTESVQYKINKITPATSAPMYNSTDDSRKLVQETHVVPNVKEAATVSEQNTQNRISSAYLTSTSKPDDSSKLIQETVYHDDILSLLKVAETTTGSVQYMINKVTSVTTQPTFKLSTDDSSKLIQEPAYPDSSLTSPKVTEATTNSEQYMKSEMTFATSVPTNKLSTDDSSKLVQEIVYHDDSMISLKVTEATTEAEQNMINKMTSATSEPTYKLSTDDKSKLIQETVYRDDSVTSPEVSKATTESEQYMKGKMTPATLVSTYKLSTDDSSKLVQGTVNRDDSMILLKVTEATTEAEQNMINKMTSATSEPTYKLSTDDTRKLVQEIVYHDDSMISLKVTEATTEAEQNMINKMTSTTSEPTYKLSTDDTRKLIQETVYRDDSLTSPKVTKATTESEQYVKSKMISATSVPTYKLSTDDSSKLIQETVYRSSLTLPKVTEATTESEQYMINKITSATLAPTYKLSTDDSSKLIQETVNHDDSLSLPKVTEVTTESEQYMKSKITSATSVPTYKLDSSLDTNDSSKLIQETVYHDDSLTSPKVTKATTESEQYMKSKITSATSVPTYKLDSSVDTNDSSKLIQETVYHDDSLTSPKVTKATTKSEQNMINKITSATSEPTYKFSTDDTRKVIQGTVYHDDSLTSPKVTKATTESEQYMKSKMISATSVPTYKLSTDDSSKLIQETVYRSSLTLPKVTEATTESEQYMINKITSATLAPTYKLSTDDSSKLIQETVNHDDSFSLPKVTEVTTETEQYMKSKITSATSVPTYKLDSSLDTNDSSKLIQETVYHDDSLTSPKVTKATTESEQYMKSKITSATSVPTYKLDSSVDTNDSSKLIQETVYHDDSLTSPKVTKATTKSEQNMINKITSATSEPTYKLSTDDTSKLIQETLHRDDSLTSPKVSKATTESEQYMKSKMTSATSVPTYKLSTDDSSKLLQETIYRDSSLTLPKVAEATTESEQYMINKITSATLAPTHKLSTDDSSKLIQVTVNRDDSLSLPKVTESEEYMINEISKTSGAPTNKLPNHDSSILKQQETAYHGDILVLPKVTNVATDPKPNTLNRIPSAPSTSNEKRDDSSKSIQLTGSRDKTLSLTKVTQITTEPKQNIENIILSAILVAPEAENSNSYKVLPKAEHKYDTLTLFKGTAATGVPEDSMLNQISSTALEPPTEPETVDSNKSIQKVAYRDETVKVPTVEEVTTVPKQNTQNIMLSTILVPNGNSNIEDSSKLIKETVHSYDTLILPTGTVATAVPERSILNKISSTTLAPPSGPDTADSIKLKPQSVYHGDTTAVPEVAAVSQKNVFQSNTDNSSRLTQQDLFRGETLMLQNISEVTPKPKQNMPNRIISAASSTSGGKPDSDDSNKITITGTRFLRSSLVSNNTQKIYANTQFKTITDPVTKLTSTVETVNINDHKTMREPTHSNMNVSEVIFTNDTVNNYSSQIQKKSPENIITDKAMLQKSTGTQNITLISKITSYLSNREDINLETKNDTMIRAQINVDIGADKNVSNFSIQEKYDSNPSYLEVIPQLNLTSPNPMVDSENPVKNRKKMTPMVTANGTSNNRMHMVNPLIYASDNTTSRKTFAANKSNRVYSSVNASMPVFDKDNEQANNNEQSSIIKTKVEESISYHNLTKQPNSFNDNLKQQVYTVYAPDNQTYSTSNQQIHPVNIEKKLTNGNTYTDFTANNNESNMSNTGISFDCQSLTRGKYADNKDCRKFYICLGKLQPIVGTCPNHTVFSEINKQCTRNLSHCVRNNQFHCLYEGRFSDFFKDNIYYICVKNNLHGFYRYKLQCLAGYHLNKDTVKCAKDDEITSHSASSISERSRSNNDEIKTTLKSKEGENSENNFKCKEEGKFPHSMDCRKYYVCSKNKKKEYRRKIKKCSDEEVYDKENEKCTSAESYEC